MLRLPLTATILCLYVATSGWAQVGVSSTAQPSAISQIQSTRIDSFTSVAQERAILTALAEPCQFEWTKGTSLRDIQRDLSRRIPTVVNRQALESQGITLDEVVGDDWPLTEPANEPPSPRVFEPHEDPFGASYQDPFSEQAKPDAKVVSEDKIEIESPSEESSPESPSATPWWRQSESPGNAATDMTRQTLAARLSQVLSSADLVIVIRWGQLMITTIDDAEYNLELRVYDLTPLAREEASRTARSQSGGGSAVDMSGIMEAIQNSISPDTWEVLGGTSTMTPYYNGNRASLLIATTTTTHWQIQALLDLLKRM